MHYKKQISTAKIIELSVYISLIVIAIISFFMCLFKHTTPFYVCLALTVSLIIFFIVYFFLNYDVSGWGIVLVILGAFLILMYIILIFAYNDALWAHKFLWVALYIIYEIAAFLCTNVGLSNGVFNDVYILNACISFTLFLYLYLFNLYIKQQYGD